MVDNGYCARYRSRESFICEERSKHPVRTIFRDRAGVPSFAA